VVSLGGRLAFFPPRGSISGMLAQPPSRTWQIAGRKIAFRGTPLVMGILNVTPDSFSDGGAYRDPEAAVTAALRMIEEGADILDIGGESTRPGHVAIDAKTELARVLPVIRALASKTSTPISIDTYKAEVACRAIEAGATIVNDVWGLTRDPGMATAVAQTGAGAVIMHNRTEPAAGLSILEELRRFFGEAAERAAKAGIPEEAIVLDPGIGFGKTLEQNLWLLGHLHELRGLGFPVLLGASRKSFINKVSPSGVDDRIGGSIATTTLATLAAVDIVRVHDVAAHRQAIRVVEAATDAKA
jgi:dihydropteroate synthase